MIVAGEMDVNPEDCIRRGMALQPDHKRIAHATHQGWPKQWERYNTERTRSVIDALSAAKVRPALAAGWPCLRLCV